MEKTVNKDQYSEDRLQQECYLWFHNSYPKLRGLLFHVPNGGSRNSREAAKFKSMGLVSGVSDFIFLYYGKTYFIELKRPDGGGTQSSKQKLWEALVRSHNFQYYLVKSEDTFRLLIEAIINGANRNT